MSSSLKRMRRGVGVGGDFSFGKISVRLAKHSQICPRGESLAGELGLLGVGSFCLYLFTLVLEH